MHRSRAAWILLGIALVALAVAAGIESRRGEAALGGLPEALAGRGRVLRLDPGVLEEREIDGLEWVALDQVPGAAEALGGFEPSALATALREAEVDGLVVAPRPDGFIGPDATVEQRLRALGRMSPLVGTHLSPIGALYRLVPRAEVEAHGEALARTARRIVSGSPPPPTSAFPAPLRELGSVEVMVLLRLNGRPKLWRSARDSSIARALVTAATVARQRWNERESAMGGSIDRFLPTMEVEVSLLEEDGTLGATDAAFLERAFTDVHGVAYEQRGGRRAWRYLLPEATRSAGDGSAAGAYRELFRQNDLPEESFDRQDIRFYRMVVTTLGRSSGALGSSAPTSPTDSEPAPFVSGDPDGFEDEDAPAPTPAAASSDD